MQTRSLALALCAALSFGAAVAADAPDKCPPRPGFAMVSPEQRLMMFADLKAQADSGAVDLQILRQMQRDKLKAMTPDQRKAYFDGLTKRWNAMPADKQAALKSDAAKWRSEHPRPEGGRPEGGREGGHEGGRPGCPPPAH